MTAIKKKEENCCIYICAFAIYIYIYRYVLQKRLKPGRENIFNQIMANCVKLLCS
jgi:hypothetical protein